MQTSDSGAFSGGILPGPIDPPYDLICPADAIIDRTAIAHALDVACTSASNEAELRPEMVRILGDARDAGMARIQAAFEAEPFKADPTIRAYTWLTDCIVAATYQIATTRLHPLPNPTEGERLSLLGVGGYGRGDMAPASDIDLLFLTPHKITPWAESVIESMLYVFWDMHLKVGHASRTVNDCLRLGREDYTIRTALLEQRYLVGDANLAVQLQETLRTELFKGTAHAFIEAKLAERDARHLKQGERYVVEPNVKEGKGGLRDLQSLFWIAKYMYDVRDVDDLVRLKVFTPEELAMFEEARISSGPCAAICTSPRGAPTKSSASTCRSRWPSAWGIKIAAGVARSNTSCRITSATPPLWAI